MQVNIDTLQVRIERLKNLVAESPSHIEATEKIEDILKTAPQMIENAENALRSGELLQDIKISPADKKVAADIHKFVMKKKKKGRGVGTIPNSPHMMKYKGFYDFALFLILPAPSGMARSRLHELYQDLMINLYFCRVGPKVVKNRSFF